MEAIRWKFNQKARENPNQSSSQFLGRSEVAKVRDFHQTFEAYSVTPLRNLSRLACYLGVSGIYVKDESYRFGLNAFKVLGGAYAIGKYLADRLGMKIENLSFDFLKSKEMKERLGEITFISATDGNHGRGIAWAAQQLGQKAVIYMPKGSSLIRLHHITSTGAEGYITDMNYDECVRLCAEKAKENGWIVVQDTAWEGYQEIPTWIMQGYATMALEAMDQLKEWGIDKPTHIFLQAGVGSYAAAIQGLFSSIYGEERPYTAVVEPEKASCLYLSALADDGNPRHVTGQMDTIMAGLACGEPNPIAWNILKDCADMFISCPDYVAAKGMRILGNPLGDDARIISGESGAVTTGILSFLMTDHRLEEAKKLLRLDRDSKILLINTEGDTDPDNYRRIVWDGYFPSFD